MSGGIEAFRQRRMKRDLDKRGGGPKGDDGPQPEPAERVLGTGDDEGDRSEQFHQHRWTDRERGKRLVRALVVWVSGRADATHQRIVNQLHKPDEAYHIKGRPGVHQE